MIENIIEDGLNDFLYSSVQIPGGINYLYILWVVLRLGSSVLEQLSQLQFSWEKY
jgi:hypothetical protein